VSEAGVEYVAFLHIFELFSKGNTEVKVLKAAQNNNLVIKAHVGERCEQ
jgi:hypothetical protein